MGEARFTEPKTVRGDAERRRHAAAARRARLPQRRHPRQRFPTCPVWPIAGPMTHVEALNLERLPEHLVILGGGYVGLEFAQAMRRFGSRVTIIQRGPRLLEREDPDVADALLELMKDEGVEVLLQAEVLSVTGRSGTGVALQVRSGAAERTLEASDILVAAGRTPNTDRLDAGQGRRRAGCARLHPRQRPASSHAPRTSGRRASVPAAPSSRTSARTIVASSWTTSPAAAGRRRGRLIPVLPVHRPGTGPRRPERIRSQGQGRALPHRPDAHVDGAADAHAVADARVHEGARSAPTTASWASPRSARKRAS